MRGGSDHDLGARRDAGRARAANFRRCRSPGPGRSVVAGSGGSSAAPAPRRAWALAVALLLLVPAASFTLYQRLGNPVAAIAATAVGSGTGHEVSEQQIAAMVESLAKRLKQNPNDADGWVLLAHSYQALERFPNPPTRTPAPRR